MMEVRVCAEPAMLAGGLTGWTAVVIDALRMTSVAVTAVANGCAGLRAEADVDDARREAAQAGALLGGERSALPIEGFDFDNSPLSYTPARVKGQRIVMSTSNGTRAIAAAAGARRVLLGAFVNAAAVADAVQSDAQVALVCAGTLGAFTLEDALAAGAMLDRLAARDVRMARDDMAIAVQMLYAQGRDDLQGALAETAHYRRLQSLGMEEDLAYCLSEDALRAVPERGSDGWFG